MCFGILTICFMAALLLEPGGGALNFVPTHPTLSETFSRLGGIVKGGGPGPEASRASP